jgi:hypothetical protein
MISHDININKKQHIELFEDFRNNKTADGSLLTSDDT